jgi:hypothetical protein
MFYLRLNRLKIADNGAVKSGLGLFGHDYASMQLVSMVTTSNTDLPNLDALLRATTPEQRAEALRPAVENSVASRICTRIDQVTDHDVINFGDTGYGVYESDKTPESFNWILLAIKSRQNVRDGAETVNRVLTHQDFDQTANAILTLVKGGAAVANPALAAGMQVARFVAGVTAQGLMSAHDKQLGVVSTTLTRAEHYVSGVRNIEDAPDSTGNMWYDYSIFAYERAIAVNPQDGGQQ